MEVRSSTGGSASTLESDGFMRFNPAVLTIVFATASLSPPLIAQERHGLGVWAQVGLAVGVNQFQYGSGGSSSSSTGLGLTAIAGVRAGSRLRVGIEYTGWVALELARSQQRDFGFLGAVARFDPLRANRGFGKVGLGRARAGFTHDEAFRTSGTALSLGAGFKLFPVAWTPFAYLDWIQSLDGRIRDPDTDATARLIQGGVGVSF